MKCTICKNEKSEDEFPLNGDKRHGRRHQCKECMRQINRAWRAKNKKHVALYNKKRKELREKKAYK